MPRQLPMTWTMLSSRPHSLPELAVEGQRRCRWRRSSRWRPWSRRSSRFCKKMDADQASELVALEGIVSDPSAEPIKLSYGLLKLITGNFATEIGRGGFGVVYQGSLQNGVVAVKKISNAHELSDKLFMYEIRCLIRAKHENIVRFLGYCSDTQGEVMEYKGTYVMTEVQKRLLCFEYVPNGNIQDYLEEKVDGDTWIIRHQIIKGICQGLHYLHEKRINHLDLKPANVMLDACNQPKITDFGLARFLVEGQSKVYTKIIRGTPGYIAPKNIDTGEISLKSDIYALGIIIIKLLTGRNVIDFDNWHKSLDIDNPQVRGCIKIAGDCMEADQEKRPTIGEIVRELNAIGSMVEELTHDTGSSTHQVSHMVFPGTKMLDVYPLELHFPFIPEKEEMQCQLSLINKTDGEVVFLVLPALGVRPLNGILMSLCTTVFTLKILSKEMPGSSGEVLLLMFIMKSNKDVRELMKISLDIEGVLKISTDDLYEKVHEMGGDIHMAKLRAFIDTEYETMTSTFTSDASTNICRLKSKVSHFEEQNPQESIFFSEKGVYLQESKYHGLEVHPSKPWIMRLATHAIYIWNYQTNGIIDLIINKAHSAKFIARKQWLVIGTSDSIHVYTCPTLNRMENVRKFEVFPRELRDAIMLRQCYTEVVVHPTRPFVLSYCQDSYDGPCMKLWNWDRNWSCTQTFEISSPTVLVQIMVNTRDTNTFTTLDLDNRIKIWKFGFSQPIATLEGFKDSIMLKNVFTNNGDRHFLTSISGANADIWDLKKGKHVHTLSIYDRHCPDDKIVAAICHPKRPVLVTASEHGYVHVWDCYTYRIKKKYVNLHQAPRDLAFVGSGRLVIAYDDGVEITDNDLE